MLQTKVKYEIIDQLVTKLDALSVSFVANYECDERMWFVAGDV